MDPVGADENVSGKRATPVGPDADAALVHVEVGHVRVEVDGPGGQAVPETLLAVGAVNERALRQVPGRGEPTVVAS